MIFAGKIETYIPYTEIPLNINCNYFAIILLVCCTKYLNDIFIEGKLEKIDVILFSILSISLFLTMGRMAILTYFFIFLLAVILSILKGKNLRSLFYFFGLLFLSLLIFHFSRFGHSRLNVLLTDVKNLAIDQIFLNRVDVYRVAIEAIGEAPYTGYGLKGSQEILNLKYQKYGYTHLRLHQYHAHNQFLQVMLYFGIFGGILLTTLLLLPLIHIKNILPIFISITFGLTFLTDSPLTDLKVLTVFIILYSLIIFDIFLKIKNKKFERIEIGQ